MDHDPRTAICPIRNRRARLGGAGITSKGADDFLSQQRASATPDHRAPPDSESGTEFDIAAKFEKDRYIDVIALLRLAKEA